MGVSIGGGAAPKTRAKLQPRVSFTAAATGTTYTVLSVTGAGKLYGLRISNTSSGNILKVVIDGTTVIDTTGYNSLTYGQLVGAYGAQAQALTASGVNASIFETSDNQSTIPSPGADIGLGFSQSLTITLNPGVANTPIKVDYGVMN